MMIPWGSSVSSSVDVVDIRSPEVGKETLEVSGVALPDVSAFQAVEAWEAALGKGRDISTPGEVSRLPRVRVERVGTGIRSQSG